MKVADAGMPVRGSVAGGKQSMMSSDELTMPVWHEKHLRAATRAAGVALWAWNVDTDAITMDKSAYELWEVPKERTEDHVRDIVEKHSSCRSRKGEVGICGHARSRRRL